MTAVTREYVVTNVASVALDMRCRSDAEPDSAQLFVGGGVHHPKVVRGHFVNVVIGELDQRQPEFAIDKHSRICGYLESGDSAKSAHTTAAFNPLVRRRGSILYAW